MFKNGQKAVHVLTGEVVSIMATNNPAKIGNLRSYTVQVDNGAEFRACEGELTVLGPIVKHSDSEEDFENDCDD
jgi:hypothetical protein